MIFTLISTVRACPFYPRLAALIAWPRRRREYMSAVDAHKQTATHFRTQILTQAPARTCTHTLQTNTSRRHTHTHANTFGHWRDVSGQLSSRVFSRSIIDGFSHGDKLLPTRPMPPLNVGQRAAAHPYFSRLQDDVAGANTLSLCESSSQVVLFVL